MPRDRLVELATDYIVLLSDPHVEAASATSWDISRPHYERVHETVYQIVKDYPEGRTALDELRSSPDNPRAYDALADFLQRRLKIDGTMIGELSAAFSHCEEIVRIIYSAGRGHPSPPPASPSNEQLAKLARSLKDPAPAAPDINVIIPFRDGDGGERLRNLLAAISSLRIDAADSEVQILVTIVESNERPHWEPVIRSSVDQYVFAANPGPFNKAWAVNCAFTALPVRGVAVCIYDGDIAATPGFLRHGLNLLAAPEVVGLHYAGLTCLDPASSNRVATELLDERRLTDTSAVRGFTLVDPPGGCNWATADAYAAIGGMDERYEGWGREDNDFVRRLRRHGDMVRSSRAIQHLYHPRPQMRSSAGSLMNLDVWEDWAAQRSIGQLDKYVTAAHAS